MALLIKVRPLAGPTLRSLLTSGSRTFTSRAHTASSSQLLSSALKRISPITEPYLSSYHAITLKQIRFNTTNESAKTMELADSAPIVEGDAPARMQSGPTLRTLDRSFVTYEERSQRIERVSEKDFAKIFDLFTRVIQSLGDDVSKLEPGIASNINLYSNILLRSCGRLMLETPPKGRELLAGNLWTFIKEKSIPTDISHYNSLIRVMNENETNFDPKIILEELKSRNLVADRITYQRLIHQYCLQGDVTGATDLLEKMKDLGLELSEPVFASLILGYMKQEQPPSIKDMFDLMRQNGLEPNSSSYTAAFVSMASRLERDPNSAKDLEELCNLFEKDEVQLSPNDLANTAAALTPIRSKYEFVDQLVAKISDNLNFSIADRYRLLTALLRVNQFEQASKIFWALKVSEKNLRNGNIGGYWIRAMAINRNVPAEFALKECQMIRDREYNLKAFHLLYFNAAETGNLNLVRESLKVISELETMKIHYIWPLIAQAKDEKELIEVLKNDLNPSLDSSDLLETFSGWVWPKFSNNFQRLFDLNKNGLKFDNNVLMASFLSYAVQENKFVEALKFISEAPLDIVGNAADGDRPQQQEDNGDADGEIGELRSRTQTPRSNERGALVARLLNQIVDQTKDPELVRKAFNLCLVPGHPISNRSFAALVRVHLLNNDYDKAMDEFLRVFREHRAAPCREELIKHCLVTKNPERLQKIMNCTSELYGEQNSLFDLAVCCLKSGKLKQAQKIFASPGFRVRPVRVYQTCRAMARQRHVDALENFVSLTRDMYDVNQDYLYEILVNTYDSISNPKRALHLWNMMQEEEFQPSKRSLLMIANILERNNIEVPFQKPKADFLEQKGTRNRVV